MSARNIRMNAHNFMRETMSELSLTEPTPFAEIVANVARGEDERESVEKVLNVMVAQKYANKEGEGETAAYTLTESGSALYREIGGK